MTKAFWEFWLFLIPGAIVSRLISIFSHDIMGVARGVPFARFGIVGTVAQISLLLLPFVIGASIAAVFYFRRHRRIVDSREVANCAKKIGYFIFALTVLFFALSGAWFGLVQAPMWMIAIILFAPSLSATAIFWIVFLTTIRLVAYCRSLG
ncbi:hypothetical protein [Ruegeria sp. AU67]|uniref:hypothetical protein n=1 Tax=Ruegeria sp. AU67 TaxID=2108530 RepID=UPI001359A8D8|nr:hypothetical protein [Ruegeria sp. AU67]